MALVSYHFLFNVCLTSPEVRCGGIWPELIAKRVGTYNIQRKIHKAALWINPFIFQWFYDSSMVTFMMIHFMLFTFADTQVCITFAGDYLGITGSKLPYRDLGYRSLQEFLAKLPDVVSMKR